MSAATSLRSPRQRAKSKQVSTFVATVQHTPRRKSGEDKHQLKVAPISLRRAKIPRAVKMKAGKDVHGSFSSEAESSNSINDSALKDSDLKSNASSGDDFQKPIPMHPVHRKVQGNINRSNDCITGNYIKGGYCLLLDRCHAMIVWTIDEMVTSLISEILENLGLSL